VLRAVTLVTVVALAAGCQSKASSSGAGAAASASASSSDFAFPGASRTTGPSTAVHATRGSLTIGSAGFTESEVLAAVYSALLTKRGYAVKISSIPATNLLQTALEKHQVDVVPQYAAAYTDQLNALIRGGGVKRVASSDLTATMAQLAPLAVSRGVTPLKPTPAVDELAFAVGTTFATRNAVATLSDLGRLGVSVKLAAGAECATDPACQPGLLATYGIRVSVLDPLGVDTLPAKNAVQNGRDQLVAVRTTDGTLAASKLVVLADDKHLQPAGNIVPIVNKTSLAKHPDIAATLNTLAGVLSTEDVARMIAAVEVAGQGTADVADAYLRSKGLL
jgi:osmoprotectant transport system substrate-binding protein